MLSGWELSSSLSSPKTVSPRRFLSKQPGQGSKEPSEHPPPALSNNTLSPAALLCPEAAQPQSWENAAPAQLLSPCPFVLSSPKASFPALCTWRCDAAAPSMLLPQAQAWRHPSGQGRGPPVPPPALQELRGCIFLPLGPAPRGPHSAGATRAPEPPSAATEPQSPESTGCSVGTPAPRHSVVVVAGGKEGRDGGRRGGRAAGQGRAGWGAEAGAAGRGAAPASSPRSPGPGAFSAERAFRQTPRPAAQLAAHRPLHVPGKAPPSPSFRHFHV